MEDFGCMASLRAALAMNTAVHSASSSLSLTADVEQHQILQHTERLLVCQSALQRITSCSLPDNFWGAATRCSQASACLTG